MKPESRFKLISEKCPYEDGTELYNCWLDLCLINHGVEVSVAEMIKEFEQPLEFYRFYIPILINDSQVIEVVYE